MSRYEPGPIAVSAIFVINVIKLAVFGMFMPGLQIWFMLFSRWMNWWPEPGVTWFDWIMALILPFYAIWQTVVG